MEQTPLWELSANMTDPETGEVLLVTDSKFTKYMELMERYYHNIKKIRVKSVASPIKQRQ